MTTNIPIATSELVAKCSLHPVAPALEGLPQPRELPGIDIAAENAGPPLKVEPGYDPDLWLYRERTIALLRRYLRLSIEVGRLPSILGRELFRSKVTSYRMSSFEDAVIFVHDVERVIEQLDSFSKDLIAVIIFQDYSQDEAADVLRCARRTVCREFPETLDRVSAHFLNGGLLNRLPQKRPVENSCQEGKTTQFSASAWKQSE
jgi:hypothetical protein